MNCRNGRCIGPCTCDPKPEAASLSGEALTWKPCKECGAEWVHDLGVHTIWHGVQCSQMPGRIVRKLATIPAGTSEPGAREAIHKLLVSLVGGYACDLMGKHGQWCNLLAAEVARARLEGHEAGRAEAFAEMREPLLKLETFLRESSRGQQADTVLRCLVRLDILANKPGGTGNATR